MRHFASLVSHEISYSYKCRFDIHRALQTNNHLQSCARRNTTSFVSYRIASHRVPAIHAMQIIATARIRRNRHHANIPIVSNPPTNANSQKETIEIYRIHIFLLFQSSAFYSHPILNISYNRSLPAPGIKTRTRQPGDCLIHFHSWRHLNRPVSTVICPLFYSGPFTVKALIQSIALSPDVGFVLITSDQPCNVVRIISSTQILTL